MKINTRFFILALSSVAMLSACAPDIDTRLKYASDYWQREDSTSALYMRGAKAQQILHQDISQCTWEVSEIERLSALREATPADKKNGGIPADPNSPEGKIAKWGTPEREGDMRFEHMDYHDFETCMHYKGWERVEYLPYDTAESARENYLESVIGRKYQSRYGYDSTSSTSESEESKDDYSNMNQ